MSCDQGKSGICILVVSILLVAPAVGMSLESSLESEKVDLAELSLEDLLNIEVTSVSKRPQSLHDAPAAVFVISNDDLLRLGVTTIPEALRYVPGLHVGRIDGNKWAVTSRGFNGRFSNKLLVLVDGRNVYATSFSGVYWEVQDILIEDIDRIEIIRGPGATLWGANAVNGVINIITKNSAETLGGLVVAGAGDIEQGFAAVRYGMDLTDGMHARFYGKAFGRDEFPRPDGQGSGDDWQMYRGGFRIDTRQSASDALSFQGDIYGGTINQQTTLATLTSPYSVFLDEEAKVSGGHLLGRMVRTLSPDSELSLQVYFDRAVLDEAIMYSASNQVDYDFQHQFKTQKQTVVWGLGYHYSNNILKRRAGYLLAREKRDFSLFSAFIQDEIALSKDRLALTVGSKFEHNEYTGLEVQPSARLIWRAHDSHRVWASATRAVRTPMRAEDEYEVLIATVPPNSPTNPSPLPVGVMMTGNEDFVSEELLAYELGYRLSRSAFSVDITAFYHDHSKLQDNDPGTPEVRYQEDPPYIDQPMVFNNNGASSSYGIELATAWQMQSWLRWDLAYSFIESELDLEDKESARAKFSPRHQASLVMDLKPVSAVNLSAGLRYVDECMAGGMLSIQERRIPGYITADAQIRWRMGHRVELSLTGHNLLEKTHWEYVAESFTLPTVVPRSYYAKIRLEF